MLSLNLAELPLLLSLLLQLQFAGIACLDCSNGYPPSDGITLNATCHPSGRIDWVATVHIESDVIRIVYNCTCTGPNTTTFITGVALPSTRNHGPTESDHFQIPGWNYSTSVCYFDGCYANENTFKKSSLFTTPCTVLVPLTITEEPTPPVLPSHTSSIVPTLVPSSERLATTSVSPQQSTSHTLPAASTLMATSTPMATSTLMATPQPSPLTEDSASKNSDKNTIVILIGVSLFILLLLCCFIAFLAVLFAVLRRRQKTMVDFRYLPDEKQQVADQLDVHIGTIKPSNSTETFIEALCIHEKKKYKEEENSDSDVSIILEGKEEEPDVHSECDTCSLSDQPYLFESDVAASRVCVPSSTDTSGQFSEFYVPHSSASLSGLSEALIEERDDMICVCDDESVPYETSHLTAVPMVHPQVNSQQLQVARTVSLTEDNCARQEQLDRSHTHLEIPQLQPLPLEEHRFRVNNRHLPQDQLGSGEQSPADSTELPHAQLRPYDSAELPQAPSDGGELPQALLRLSDSTERVKPSNLPYIRQAQQFPLDQVMQTPGYIEQCRLDTSSCSGYIECKLNGDEYRQMDNITIAL